MLIQSFCQQGNMYKLITEAIYTAHGTCISLITEVIYTPHRAHREDPSNRDTKLAMWVMS